MEDKQIRIAVRLPEDLKNEFTSICKDNAINGSELIRQFIQKWVDEKKGRNNY